MDPFIMYFHEQINKNINLKLTCSICEHVLQLWIHENFKQRIKSCCSYNEKDMFQKATDLIFKGDIKTYPQ